MRVDFRRSPEMDYRAKVTVPAMSLLVALRPVAPARVAARRADGSLLTLSDLPGVGMRWTLQHKRVVVECVEHDLLQPSAAERRYGLSAAELGEWQATVLDRGRAPVFWRERPQHLSSGRVRAGPVEIDLDARRLRVGRAEVVLSDAEWRVLSPIVEGDGAIVSTAMIMAVLYADRDKAAGRKIVDVIVCRLRCKLGAEAGCIETVWGRGHRLVR
jgi:hypothetical protein